jgi:hypothetical protein
MVDCVHRDKEFFIGRWNFAECLALYGELCRLISAIEIVPIGRAVVCEIFDQIPAEDLALLSAENVRLGNPLDACFQGLLQQLLNKMDILGKDDKVAVAFDQDGRQIEEKFAEFCFTYGRSYFQGDFIAGIGFADSKELTGLQAADLISYGTREVAELLFSPPTSEPYFPVIPALWNMLMVKAGSPRTSPDGNVFDLIALKEVVEKVKRGEMLPKKRGL